jgi:hypothetical protein
MVAKRRSRSKRPCHITWLRRNTQKGIIVVTSYHFLLLATTLPTSRSTLKLWPPRFLPTLSKHLDDEFTSHYHIRCRFFSMKLHATLSSVRPSYAWRSPQKVFYNFQVLCGNLPLHSFPYIIRVKMGDNGLSGALRVASHALQTCAM